MRNTNKFISGFLNCITVLAFIVCFQPSLNAQDRPITLYQYRLVPEDKVAEFIKRETTYWSKVAEKAAKDKTMTFWGLFEKVGGYNLPNSPNFLFINTFPDIDKAGDVFSNVESVAGVKMAEMETNSMSKITSEFFLQSNKNFVRASNSVPEKDFNYVVFIYHNTNYPDSLVNLEKKYWAPFIQKAMDNKQTTQKGWGNEIVLAPAGEDIKFTTVSYDIYKTLKDALLPNWDPKTVFPETGLGLIRQLELGRRGVDIYHVVKVVSTSN